MLVPIIMTLDVFWTDQGVKLLEVQHARTSGTKGYKDLYGLDLATAFLPALIGKLEKKKYKWIPDHIEFYQLAGSAKPKEFSGYIDGNHVLHYVMRNKGVQSIFLQGLGDLLPKEYIFEYDPNWIRLSAKIKERFSDCEEIVVKALGGACGEGIYPMRMAEISDLENEVLWGSYAPEATEDHREYRELSEFEPAFVVQERVKPIPLELEGKRYFAPIRMWMALIPENGKLIPYFFDDISGVPPPIYYKLPRPEGDGDYRSSIVSDIHQEKGAAKVSKEIRDAIYVQLVEAMPPVFENLMNAPFQEAAFKFLKKDMKEALPLGFYFLSQMLKGPYSELLKDDRFIGKIHDGISARYFESRNFRDYVRRVCFRDPEAIRLLLAEKIFMPDGRIAHRSGVDLASLRTGYAWNDRIYPLTLGGRIINFLFNNQGRPFSDSWQIQTTRLTNFGCTPPGCYLIPSPPTLD